MVSKWVFYGISHYRISLDANNHSYGAGPQIVLVAKL